MTYTALSAQYANAEHTSAIILTKEAGAVAISERDTPELWEKVLAALSPSPYQHPAPPTPTFLAQDMLALLTDDDCTAIQQEIAANISLWRLWQSLLSQRDPISVEAERFLQGWTGMKAVLGDFRCAELAEQLGFPSA